jgi:hypothetical protein
MVLAVELSAMGVSGVSEAGELPDGDGRNDGRYGEDDSQDGHFLRHGVAGLVDADPEVGDRNGKPDWNEELCRKPKRRRGATPELTEQEK